MIKIPEGEIIGLGWLKPNCKTLRGRKIRKANLPHKILGVAFFEVKLKKYFIWP